MKAFKQINLQRESRWVWSSSILLIFIGVFLMFSPVLAQLEDPHKVPQVKVDVKKIYDEDGNLVRTDSVRTWWSENHISEEAFDSIWKNFSENFDELLPRNFDHFGFHSIPPGQSMHPYWHWNGSDSSAYSYLDKYFDEDFLKNFHEKFNFHGRFDNWEFDGMDSIDMSFHNFDRFDEFFDENFQDQFDNFQDRFQKYHEEHQQLIDKYFRQPYEEEEPEPGDEEELEDNGV